MRYGCSVPCNSLDYKSGCTVPIVQQDITCCVLAMDWHAYGHTAPLWVRCVRCCETSVARDPLSTMGELCPMGSVGVKKGLYVLGRGARMRNRVTEYGVSDALPITALMVV